MDSGEDFLERFIDYHPDAQAQMSDLETTIPRFRQILGGAHSFLKGSAHKGKPVFGPMYLYITGKQQDVPAIAVYYTFDSKTVTIHDIHIAEKSETE